VLAILRFAPRLEALVGKTVECDGFLHGSALIMSHWRVVA
jgi:hypothetical protein